MITELSSQIKMTKISWVLLSEKVLDSDRERFPFLTEKFLVSKVSIMKVFRHKFDGFYRIFYLKAGGGYRV